MRTALTSSLVLACLACGGPVDVAGAFSGLCSAEVTPSVDLPRVGADLPRPKLAVHLVVGPHGASLDGEPLTDRTAALAQALAQKAETANELAARIGGSDFEFRGELLVSAHPDTPIGELVPMLDTAEAAGFPNLRFLLITGDRPPPAWTDAAYAHDLMARLPEDPAARQAMLAEELGSLLSLCPPGQSVVDAVAYASAEMKCRLLAQGMEEALPSCPLTDRAKVVTAFQVALAGPPVEVGTLAIELDRGAVPLEVDGETAWELVVADLLPRADQHVWLAVRQ